MNIKKFIINTILNILIIIFTLLFLIFLSCFQHGSYEFCPTPEQEEKAKIGYGLFMCIFGSLNLICISIKIHFQKKHSKKICTQR